MIAATQGHVKEKRSLVQHSLSHGHHSTLPVLSCLSNAMPAVVNGRAAPPFARRLLTNRLRSTP